MVVHARNFSQFSSFSQFIDNLTIHAVGFHDFYPFGQFWSSSLTLACGWPYLVIVQKRSSLLVCIDNLALSSESNFLAKDTWHSDDQGSEE